VIEHVFDRHFSGQFTIHRSDKIDQPGMIDAQIIDHLLEDELVIADMSELNPNAFYEMGIRHMKELPIIHMFRKGTDIPFDVKLYRAIPFSFDHPAELAEARGALKSAIEAVLSPNYKPDNPVIRARGVMKLQETASPETAVLMGQISEMANRLSRLEHFTPIISSGDEQLGDTYVEVKFDEQVPISRLRLHFDRLKRRFGDRATLAKTGVGAIAFVLEGYKPEDLDTVDRFFTERDVGIFHIQAKLV